MTTIARAYLRDNYAFWMLALLFALALFVGGSARGEVPGLMLLRPLAIFFAAIALLGLSEKNLRDYRGLLIGAAVLLAWVLLQLIPLPPAIWTALPGRSLAEQAATAAGMPQPWRPFAMVPWRAWNSFYSLFVPLAALLLAIRCTAEQRVRLLVVIIAVIAVSAAVGAMQALAPSRNLMHIYHYTSDGVAVGLLANRNHQAVLLCCLLPALAAFASDPAGSQWRRRGCLVAAFALVPLVLATGSRAGSVIFVLAACVSLLVYRKPPRRAHDGAGLPRNVRLALVAGALLLAVVGAILISRSVAVDRFMHSSGPDEIRFLVWKPALDAANLYFPFGSGIGSFVEIYQRSEPLALIDTSYTNHAHNELLEIWLEGGVLGLVLLVAAIIWWIRRTRSLFLSVNRGTQLFRCAAAGAVMILLICVGSMVDYPLRVPILAMVASVCAVWLASPLEPGRDSGSGEAQAV